MLKMERYVQVPFPYAITQAKSQAFFTEIKGRV